MCLHRTRVKWVMLNTTMEILGYLLVYVPNAVEWRIIQVAPHVKVAALWRSSHLLLPSHTIHHLWGKHGLDFRCSLVIKSYAFTPILLRHFSAVLVQAPAILVGGMNAFQLIKPFLLLAGFIYDVLFQDVKCPFFSYCRWLLLFCCEALRYLFQSS